MAQNKGERRPDRAACVCLARQAPRAVRVPAPPLERLQPPPAALLFLLTRSGLWGPAVRLPVRVDRKGTFRLSVY